MKLLERGMISGRQAADYLDISDNTFMKALEGGHLVPQMELLRPLRKPERGFAMQYLEAVKAILPDKRIQRMTVFTEEVIKRLQPINKSWRGKTDVDWEKDNRETVKYIQAARGKTPSRPKKTT